MGSSEGEFAELILSEGSILGNAIGICLHFEGGA
jgi:hypothetical protein